MTRTSYRPILRPRELRAIVLGLTRITPAEAGMRETEYVDLTEAMTYNWFLIDGRSYEAAEKEGWLPRQGWQGA